MSLAGGQTPRRRATRSTAAGDDVPTPGKRWDRRGQRTGSEVGCGVGHLRPPATPTPRLADHPGTGPGQGTGQVRGPGARPRLRRTRDRRRPHHPRRRPHPGEPGVAVRAVPQGQDRTRDSSTEHRTRRHEATSSRDTPRRDAMKITLTKPLGGNDKGDTIEVPDPIGERLIARGVAEKPKATRKSATDSD